MIEYYIYQNEDDKTVRTETDPGLLDAAPQEDRPWLAWVFVRMHSPDVSGMCKNSECDLLRRMQTDLTEALREKLDAVISGVRIQEGWMELFFYLPTARKFDNIAAEVMKKYAFYSFETGSSRDAKWLHYRNELYPDALMLQQIRSRAVIRELEEAGDNIVLLHEVEHYLFFQTEAQRKRAVQKLEASGFVLKENVRQEGEFGYGAVLVRKHDITESTLTEVTAELFDAVRDEYGLYEGWSTVLAT
jgi:regulator of RNase E activity RraB